MKNVLLRGCFLLFSTVSFAQRHADLSLTMTAPDSTTTIGGTQSFNLTATLTNNGPDVLKTTDTLALAFILDNGSSPVSMVVNGQTVSEIGFMLPSQMASGASGNINQAVAFAASPSFGKHSLCAIVIAVNRSSDSVKDDSPSNNKACADIIIVNPASVAGIEQGKILKGIYPNPARQSASVDIDLPSGDHVSVTICDLLGRTVYSQDYGYIPAGASTFHVNTGSLPTGNYFLGIKAGGNYNCERITVQQ